MSGWRVGDRKRKHEAEPAVDEDAPTSINLGNYVENREREMIALMKAVKTRTGTCTALQALPKHMRRRAASHNTKRLPDRVRPLATKLMESQGGPPSKIKRPSRKYRRRPKNLLEEYTRRARNHCWLETHIWHAKRFKMSQLWGYKVPLHPCDKGVRPAYRAMAKYCLLQDISYFVCIEIEGHKADIIEGMNKLCSPATGPTFAAKAYLTGERQGRLMLYKANSYPQGALCPVTFLWQPPGVSTGSSINDARKLWLSVHPSSHNQVLEEIANAFGMEQSRGDSNVVVNTQNLTDASDVFSKDIVTPTTGEGVSNKNFSVAKNCVAKKRENKRLKKTKSDTVGSKPDVLADEKKNTENLKLLNPEFTNGKVHMRSLKDKLCPFRLTGALSQAVLKETCLLSNINSDENRNKLSDSSDNSYWWESFYGEPKLTSLHQSQGDLWEQIVQCASPADVPTSMVLGLTVRDPRVLLPPQKTRAVNEDGGMSQEVLTVLPPDVSSSPLWETDIRCKAKDTKITEANLNDIRSKNLVPETPEVEELEKNICRRNGGGFRKSRIPCSSSTHTESRQ